MNKSRFLFLLFFFPLLLFAQKSSPTYATDIAKIIYTKCTYCHRTGNIAPFPLENYEQVKQNQYPISGDVALGVMPPWPPDVNYNRFAHERTLSQKEKDDILNWISNGAPRGDSTQEPPSPLFPDQPVIGIPDQTFKIPDYTLQSNEDEYRAFAIPISNSTEKYLKSIEFRPANKKVVHHILLFVDSTQSCKNLDDADPLPGYLSFGGVGSNAAKLIQLWVPGQQAYIFPETLGNRIPSNSYMVIQIHYAPGFLGEKDSSSFIVKYQTSARNVDVAPILNHNTTLTNGPLFIKKDSVKTFYSRYNIPVKVTLLGVGPHMHLLGQSIKSYAIKPTGDTIPLINIKKWDFHWQGLYTFKKPVILEAGTKLCGEARYDNTANNPENPNSPPKDVSLGEGTKDEMMLIYFNYMRYQTGDENIILEDTTAAPSGNNEVIKSQEPIYNIYPNPVHTLLNLENVNPIAVNFYDLLGQKVTVKVLEQNNQFDVSELKYGLYVIRIETKEGILNKKFLKE